MSVKVKSSIIWINIYKCYHEAQSISNHNPNGKRCINTNLKKHKWSKRKCACCVQQSYLLLFVLKWKMHWLLLYHFWLYLLIYDFQFILQTISCVVTAIYVQINIFFPHFFEKRKDKTLIDNGRLAHTSFHQINPSYNQLIRFDSILVFNLFLHTKM